MNYPGYKYLGPFNRMDKGPPINELDAAAYRHDKAYVKLGYKGYTTWSEADQTFLDETSKYSSRAANWSRNIFKGKKLLQKFPNTLPMENLPSNVPHPYFANKRKRKSGADTGLWFTKQTKSNQYRDFRSNKQMTYRKKRGVKPRTRTWRKKTSYRRGGRRRGPRRRRTSGLMGGIVRKLRFQGRAIAKLKYSNTNRNVRREVQVGQILVVPNECIYREIPMLTQGQLEGMLATVPVIGRVLDGTAYEKQTMDLTIAALVGKIRIDGAKHKTTFRNNGLLTVNMAFWTFFAKGPTSTTPVSQMIVGLEERGVAVNAEEDLRYWPTDAVEVSQTWKLARKKYAQLAPGQEYTCVMNRKKPFMYNQNVSDLDSETYRSQTQILVIRAWGVPSHDASTTTLVGTSNAVIDYVSYFHLKASNIPEGGYKSLLQGSLGMGAVVDPVVAEMDVELN